MASIISAVVIDSDSASREKTEGFLKEVPQAVVVGSAADLSSGFDLVTKTKPSLVVIEMDANPDLALEIMDKVLKNAPHTSIFATSSDSSSGNILKTMRHGATDFLLRPVDRGDLTASLKKLSRVMAHVPAAAREDGRVITCFAPKGGMGNTTVATNLAVSLHMETKKPVVLVDLDLETGDISMFLNLKAKYSISDVAENIDRLDQAFLEGVLAKHPSGIHLLAEPQKVEDASIVSATQVREALQLLKTMFAYVVVDTQIGYGDTNLAAFDSADLIILTGVLILPALKNMQKAMDVFDRLGYSKDKVRLVINRYIKKGEITIDDAEKTLFCTVFKSIPNDYGNVITSVNRGIPLLQLAPNAEISRSFKELAKDAAEAVKSRRAELKQVFVEGRSEGQYGFKR